MDTLFNDIVFGPVKSRRLGVSLGINLLPIDSKICNFNCIYCECGLTNLRNLESSFYSKDKILRVVEERLHEFSLSASKIDSITFAGNGEPTLHPDFFEISAAIHKLRSRYIPESKLVLLTNATQLDVKKIRDSLSFFDVCMLKLDTGTDEDFHAIDRPVKKRGLDQYVDLMSKLKMPIAIQSLFLYYEQNGVIKSNFNPFSLNAWLNAIDKIKPVEVFIYTLDRKTPERGLSKATNEDLIRIKNLVVERGLSATAVI